VKKLNDILYGVPLKAVSGSTEVGFYSLRFDSKKVKKNDAFVAIEGTKVDGHKFIGKTIDQGASVIVCEILPDILDEKVTYVEVKNSAMALSIMAANYYGNPSKKIKLIGVTGTNGKTTVATLLYDLFNQLGYKSGLLSTIENRIGDNVLKATHTTGDAIQLNENLNEMLKQGCTHCFMEVSSHALDQKRVAGIEYSGALFTNISHDHLDYHKTFDAYISAKKELFDGLPKSAFALVNTDDRRGKIMLQNTKAAKSTYSLKSASDFKGKIISNTLNGLEMNVDNQSIWFKLFGDFNAYNILSVYGTAILMGEQPEDVLTILSNIDPVPGRMEIVHNSVKITALVDYAHTPDALKNVLESVAGLRTGNETVITVVGCGGDRDKDKRPLMGSIASEMSDKVIFTSDNPRSEDPNTIISEMKKGVGASNKRKVVAMVNREEAIKTACLLASPNDIILVAGKGHEDYQEIKGKRLPFDDRKILSEMLNLMKN
jgi:UDP-N-acetylmuramoyl-L-alanyl-D-glutamate--2,6-diaminopimelate ligase